MTGNKVTSIFKKKMHKQKLVLWLILATDVTHVPDQHSHIPAP